MTRMVFKSCMRYYPVQVGQTRTINHTHLWPHQSMDEPVGDPASIEKTRAIVRGVKAGGKTLMCSTILRLTSVIFIQEITLGWDLCHPAGRNLWLHGRFLI